MPNKGDYYQKYIKYKIKYNNLKNNTNNNTTNNTNNKYIYIGDKKTTGFINKSLLIEHYNSPKL
jgi:hypothetical protein